MNFERGKDIKEVLKLGRKANAIPVHKFEIQGTVSIPIDRDRLTPEMITRYNLINSSKVFVIHFNFFIEENKLIPFLRILEKDGVCKDFHEYILETGVQEVLKERSRLLDRDQKNIPLIMDPEKMSFELKWAFILSMEPVHISETAGDISHLERTQIHFNLTGKDLLFRDHLYRVAEPKDGY